MAASNQIVFSTPQRKINERSSMIVTARFRDRATNADVTPTNVYYRLDSPEIGELIGWTSVTTGTSVNVTLSATQNQIYNCTRNIEPRFMSFAADYGLSTEFRDTMRYEIRNQPYFT